MNVIPGIAVAFAIIFARGCLLIRNIAELMAMIAYAVRALYAAGTWIYIIRTVYPC